MSLRIKGITAMKWSSFSTLISIVIQLAQIVIVSRLLEPEHYGLMGMIMVFVFLALSMNDLGISNAIIHRQNVTRNELSSLYLLNLVAGAAACLAVWFLAPVASSFYQEPQLVGPMHLMAFLCFIPAIGQQFQVLFQKELKFDYLAKVDIAAFSIGFFVVLAGAYLGYGVYALVWSHLANALLKSVCLAAVGWRRWKPGWHFSRKDLKGYISFGMYQMGSNLVQTIISNLDYIILGRMLGAEKLGYYTFAFQICSMPVQKLNPLFSQISLPLLAKMQDQVDALKRGFLGMASVVSYVNAPIFLGLIVTAPYLVPFAFGSQWSPSIPIIQILAGMLLIRSIIMYTSSLLLAKGRADIAFKYTVVSLTVIFPALALGAYYGEALGVAIAYLSAQIILFGIHYRLSIRSLLGACLSDYARSLLPGISYSMIMSLGVLGIGQIISAHYAQVVILGLQIVFGAVLYGLILYFFNREQVRRLVVKALLKYSKKQA
ncbi:MOP flippase family protein [Cohnella lupini]|uniref:PST family polysaccharide transporter/lipopolysaccharide exporter n=1 Tax=Cohnella lupini TaxID=1294267 RepID=A0A3D9IVE4_9BACL|nr:MOP flippase family protein [Cohnella lupini]RED65086.1 PST family polysaccharide transporter/lipopolysaccharide exporter [Cohnella lupini]